MDTSVYLYSDETRAAVRKELGVENDFVVAHVGRFSKQKNHSFLLDVFSEIVEINPDSVLLLVGMGELEEEIKHKANRLKITDKIHFLGVRNDVPQLLSAADVFVFPSFYEGMPNTVIEAQALSLHCVISDTITPEADITGLVEYLPLCDAKQWATVALKYADGYLRQDMTEIFRNQKYDTEITSQEFINYCFGD